MGKTSTGNPRKLSTGRNAFSSSASAPLSVNIPSATSIATTYGMTRSTVCMFPFSRKVLTATLVNNRVILNYRLGAADGVTIFSRRDGECEFTPLSEDEQGPLVDGREKLDP